MQIISESSKLVKFTYASTKIFDIKKLIGPKRILIFNSVILSSEYDFLALKDLKLSGRSVTLVSLPEEISLIRSIEEDLFNDDIFKAIASDDDKESAERLITISENFLSYSEKLKMKKDLLLSEMQQIKRLEKEKMSLITSFVLKCEEREKLLSKLEFCKKNTSQLETHCFFLSSAR